MTKRNDFRLKGAWILKIVAQSLREGNCCVPVGMWTEEGIEAIERSRRFLLSAARSRLKRGGNRNAPGV